MPILSARFNVNWRTFAIACNAVPTLSFVHLLFVPESPAWLVLRDRMKQALKALKRLRGSDYPHSNELEHLRTSLLHTKSHSDKSKPFCQRITDPDVWKPFLIVNVTFILQVWTGFSILRGYIIVILQASGSRLSAYDIALISRVFTVIGQGLCTVINTRLGRKSIFILSGFFSGLSLIGFGISTWLHPNSSDVLASEDTLNNSAYSIVYDYLPPICLCMFCLAYCFGLGPIPWMYSNELYPTDLRPLLYSFAACLVPLQNFLGVKMLPRIVSALGLTTTLYIFGAVSLLSVLWGVFILPETKGLTLHQINLLFYSDDKKSLANLHNQFNCYSSVPVIRSRTISE